MSRVIFENQNPGLQVDPGRADVACFVGLVRLQLGAVVSATVHAWLKSLSYHDSAITQIFNVPVPIETYLGFTAMFDPGGSSTSFGTDYLAATIRTFFAQGGKRCYVVRTGDPVTTSDGADIKSAKLQALLPDDTYPAEDRRSWNGIGALNALPDVSFLVVPDLPLLAASAPAAAQGQVPVIPTGPEQFVECAQRDITPPQKRVFASPAPRLTLKDYDTWASAVAKIITFLGEGNIRNEQHLREVQFVAAFPLPQDLGIAAASEDSSSATNLAQDVHAIISSKMPEVEAFGDYARNLSSSFLQLSYPWLKTTASYVLLESLEPPDGALAGILARNALTRGTFTSATKITPAEIFDLWPSLPAPETKVSPPPLTWGSGPQKPLIERITLFGFTPGGLRLLSDVTAYPREAYRTASVNRLVSVICRAARRLGEEIVFESNGPALWGRVRNFLEQLLTKLWTLNALDGDSAQDAFTVLCDRSTMTQNDVDSGRLVAQVTFTAAATIELIRVTLALEASGASAQEITATLAEAV